MLLVHSQKNDMCTLVAMLCREQGKVFLLHDNMHMCSLAEGEAG